MSTVDALYADARSLAAGAGAASFAALLTFWKSSDWTLLGCAIALILIGTVRGLEMRSYALKTAKAKSIETARHWETRYMFWSAAYVAVMGLWCLLAFARTSDAVVHLISLSVLLGYLVGIAGRNFSSDRLVVVQIACAALPMLTGLLLQNEIYYILLAALFVPFYLSIRFIAARLRGILFDAVITSHDMRELTTQFDTALNNMPHGLCMFDAQHKFVVSNWRFEKLLGLRPDEDRRGVSAKDVLLEAGSFGQISSSGIDGLIVQVEARLSAAQPEIMVIETVSGRSLEMTFQPMERDGCVLLVEDITDRRISEARIEHMARYDQLTGLPNRSFFTEEFQEIVSRETEDNIRAVLFVDLDEFKQINDTLGHPFGDALLCEVAERLRGVVAPDDFVARFGGDEFVILQKIREVDDAASLAERIIKTLGQIYNIDDHQIVAGASIGISLLPRDGEDADYLLKCADIALYDAKTHGRAAWRFFEPYMDVKAQARRTLELDLRGALSRDELEVHYQPIIDIKTGRIVTCEALLRWNHHEKGMISPAEFIHVAEEMGIIVDIGRWVLREACLECKKWPGDVGVAVNISPIQFRRADVGLAVREALEVSGLPPRRLEIEITETVLLQDTPRTREILDDLRSLGVSLALDDFGTGFSSLSYLQAFPLDKVKIDRSFLSGITSDPRAMILVRGVARLSAELGMTVIIEGVETQQQLAAVAAEKSVSHVQGFLFSQVLPAQELRKLLSDDAAEMIRVA
ncbi:putative bifunctional diguanylate cyclase/phosphodiesterase [Terrihabitans sp. B22-R8]|uniref:putative bifunctional diguanylate cyclase/phosphodiesterase n=1 Tax=Terrihabitans sp. B22-R8 TaxID=3425128 RepID=UPI00403D0CEF